MRALLAVTIGLVAGLAFADGPGDVALSPDRARLLGGQLTVRLVEGMVEDISGGRAELDWGVAHFTLEATEIRGVEPGDVRARVAPAIGGAWVRVERLAVGKPWVAYAATPQIPPRIGKRDLVFAAYLLDGEGGVDILTFYVDEGGFDDGAAWAALGRRIASTMSPVHAGEPIPPRPDEAQPARLVPLPRGWSLTGGNGAYRLVSSRPDHPWCVVRDGELDAPAVSDSASAQMIAGKLDGVDVYWSQWTNGAGRGAELITGARRWGMFHAICHATKGSDLDELRRAIETRFPRYHQQQPWRPRRYRSHGRARRNNAVILARCLDRAHGREVANRGGGRRSPPPRLRLDRR